MPEIKVSTSSTIARTLANFSLTRRPGRTQQDSYLPGDVLQRIFAQLDAPTLARCSMVDKHWRANAEDHALWQAHAEARGLRGCAAGAHQRAVGVDTYMRRGQPTRTAVYDHGELLSQLSYSADGKRVATCGSGSKDVRVFDIETGNQLLKKRIGEAYDISLSPDGHHLAARSSTHGVTLTDVDSGATLASLAVMPACWVDDARFLMRTRNSDLWLQNVDPAQPVVNLAHASHVDRVVLSPDAGRLVVVVDMGADYRARIVDTASGAWVGEPIVHNRPISCVKFSPNGRILATSGQGREARLNDAQTAAPIVTIAHPHYVERLQFSPDSSKLLTAACRDGGRLYEAQSGQLVATIPESYGFGHHFGKFSPDGKLLGHFDHPWLSLIDTNTGATQTRYPYNFLISSFKFSSDSVKLAVHSHAPTIYSGMLFVDYLGTQRERLTYEYHDGLNGWCFTPDSSKIAMISSRPGVRLLDADTGNMLFDLKLPVTGRFNSFYDKAENMLVSSDGSNITFRCAEMLHLLTFKPSAKHENLLGRLQRWLGR